MGYKAEYSKTAEKYLDRQTKSVKLRIMDAIDALPEGDISKLVGREGYRLRVGSFRVLFDYTGRLSTDGRAIIDIVAIAPRGSVYK